MLDLTCISLSGQQISPIPQETVICLGNFDGVHTAHRALLSRASELQKEVCPTAARCVFCFFEPSWTAFSGDVPLLLSTLKEKLVAFYECGIEYAILCDFAMVKDFSPEQFVKDVLLEGCHCKAAVCGFNYRFGKKGIGTAKTLAALLAKPVYVEQEFLMNGDVVSSTRIRELLKQGNVREAATLLGTPYSITSIVIHGKALGKKLGFPTANQEIPQNKLVPQNGVYLTRCIIDDRQYYGMTNVGVHPTVDKDAQRNCETYLLDATVDAYGKELTVSFLEFLRPEQKFESVEALCAQLNADVSRARELIKTL